MAAAGLLRSPLRTATYRTLIGLLAATGMRVGEAIGLDCGDADLDAGVLTVRDGKHGKSRLVPVHGTTTRALRDYLRTRDMLCPDAATNAVLIPPGRHQADLLQRPLRLEEAHHLRRAPAQVR